MTFSGMHLLAVGAGGAIGASIRYATAVWLHNPASVFPWSTFVVNMAGCLLIGVLFSYVKVCTLNESLRLFLSFGVMGALTTYSTFTVEIYQLWLTYSVRYALYYLMLSLIIGIALFQLGRSVVRLVAV